MSDDILNEILRNANRHNMFRTLVEGARDRGVLLEIHADRRDLDTGRIGFVLEVGDDAFTLQELDDEGDLDGVVTISFRSVVEIRERSREICRVQALHEAPADEDAPDEDVAYSTANLVRGRLEAAMATAALVEIRIESDTDYRHIRGFVETVTADFIRLRVLSYNGDPNGIATLRMQDVATLFEDDWEIRRARRLYEMRHGLYDAAEFGQPMPPQEKA